MLNTASTVYKVMHSTVVHPTANSEKNKPQRHIKGCTYAFKQTHTHTRTDECTHVHTHNCIPKLRNNAFLTVLTSRPNVWTDPETNALNVARCVGVDSSQWSRAG